MKKVRNLSRTPRIGRLGRIDVDDQVRQAIANVTLEGLRPSDQSVSLARAVATGSMSTEEALNALRGMYAVCP